MPTQKTRTGAGDTLISPPPWRRRLALAGEEAAADYFRSLGGQVLERNWRPGRYAEIDLIGLLAGTIVFVEVKTRRTSPGYAGYAVSGFESVNRRKQQKIVTSAAMYLARGRLPETPWRVDVVVVEYCLYACDKDRQPLPAPKIIHVPDAICI